MISIISITSSFNLSNKNLIENVSNSFEIISHQNISYHIKNPNTSINIFFHKCSSQPLVNTRFLLVSIEALEKSLTMAKSWQLDNMKAQKKENFSPPEKPENSKVFFIKMPTPKAWRRAEHNQKYSCVSFCQSFCDTTHKGFSTPQPRNFPISIEKNF